jgi:hypothetical protein
VRSAAKRPSGTRNKESQSSVYRDHGRTVISNSRWQTFGVRPQRRQIQEERDSNSLSITASFTVIGETDIGTKGTLNAFRLQGTAGGAVAQAAASAVQPPNSYVSQEVNLPACWLDKTAFTGLVEVATRGMSVMPTIQAKLGDQFVRKVGIDAFLLDSTLPGRITNVQLFAGETHRTVTVNLSDYQRSTAVVWSNDPTWAEGKCKKSFITLGGDELG